MYRLAGQPATGAYSFVDVVEGWQHDPVSWLATSGITTGTSPTTFSPDETLTRADLVTFLYRYQGEPDVTVDPLTPTCDPSAFIAIAAGGLHSCGVRTDNIIACWGDNYWGQTLCACGNVSTRIHRREPLVRDRHRQHDYCWGNNHRGQSMRPRESSKRRHGASHSCALRTDDTITCWGDKEHGETDAPATTFLGLTAGASHSCAMSTDNHDYLLGQQPQRSIRCARGRVPNRQHQLRAFVWFAHRQHHQLLGWEFLWPNKRARGNVSKYHHRHVAFLCDPHRQHHHLLGLEFLWPNKRTCGTFQKCHDRRVPFLCDPHRQHHHLLGLEFPRANRITHPQPGARQRRSGAKYLRAPRALPAHWRPKS